MDLAMVRVGGLVGLLAIVCPLRLWAQTPLAPTIDANEPAAEYKRDKTLRAFRITAGPPRVDGVLDDETWSLAETAEGLVQWDPDNGEPMTERTRFQVAYDARFIYVAIRCDDRSPERIVSGLGRRDELPPSDSVAIGFDPRHDHQTGYAFMTNPSGVQFDMTFYNDQSTDRDFDAVWDVRTSVSAEGWVAEYRIPFSQLRFTASPEPGQVWGFNPRRQIHRRSESGEWTAKPRGEQGIVSRWGHLVFDAPLQPARRIEWIPYVRAGGAHFPAAEDEISAGTGVDVRVGLGSGATLSATVNPDFGQVEQDPAVLNLTVFETFFPEKRGFFLEDSRTFVPPYGIFQLFHSRRIGRRPARIGLATGDAEVDRPDDTTILGAVKVTGKQSGWTYGGLTALTSSEHATIDTTDLRRAERLVEPATSYNVARIQRDVRGGSNVGLIATGVVRRDDLDAFAGGGDYNMRWDRNRVNWNGHWVVTRAPIDGVMRSGFGGVTNVDFSRKHVGFFGHFDHFDPQFTVDDLGFFRSRADRTTVDGGFSLRQPDPWTIFRNLGFNVGSAVAWNANRDVFQRFLSASMFMQFRNYWSFETGVARDFQVLDDLDTRGGPPIVGPAKLNTIMFLASDNRKSWRLFVGGDMQRDEAGGWNVRVGPDLNLKPSSRLQASISTSYTAARDVAQWIKNIDATGDGVTDHVYGRLKRNIVDVTLRSTYAIHRDLTLQMFLQPFVAVGDYSDVRRLARARSFDFEPVTMADNPDFNNKSLRGNVVLRWEYVRGSTLFVAWNMSTSDTARPGAFRPLRDLGDAFGADGTQAVMVKMTYWLGR
jgi:hypothetical protein